MDRQEKANDERVQQCNLAVITEDDMEAAETFWIKLAKNRAHLDASCTADEVEQEAAWWQEPLGCILNTMAQGTTMWTISMSWWNANMKVRRKAVGKENIRRHILEEVTTAKAEMQKSI